MKKVLGLVMSERKLGNSEILVKEIMDNVPDPCTKEMIRLTELKIEPCKGCYRCLMPNSECAIKDDFKYVFDKIISCDALIIGFPVYFLGPHAYLKVLTDRMLDVYNHVEHTRDKPCIIVMPFGMPGWEGYAKSAAVLLPGLMQMNLKDFWQVHAALPGEGMLNSENQEKAKSLGVSLFGNQKYATGDWECPYCGADLFRLLPDNLIECPICTARGHLKNGSKPEFLEPNQCRFSTARLEEHFGGWLVNMKSKFLQEKNRLREVQKPYQEKDWWVKPD